MEKFRIEYTDEVIASNGGLALAGFIINSNQFKNILETIQIAIGIDYTSKEFKNADIIKTYLAMLCLGKNNYEDVDDFKDDKFFKSCIGLKKLPSKETLRQRMEEMSGSNIEENLKMYNTEIIKRYGSLTPCCGSEYIPVDFDVTPFDNSGSHKEGVSNTYKMVDGYAPMMTYIGDTGFMLNNQLREGKAHSNCEGTAAYIKRTLEYATQITNAILLCRFDSGNESVENMDIVNSFENARYLMKKNFRRESREGYIDFAKSENCVIETPRKGKEVYYHSKNVELLLKDDKGNTIKIVLSRLVVRLTERTIDAKGNHLLIALQDIDAWYTSLAEKHTAQEVIRFYEDHGTSEQYHSEFKTDMDMERLPSGKFSTNSLVITLGNLAFNILRGIGQNTLSSGKVKRKRKIKRMRIRKVLQDIMYMACQYMLKHKQKTIKLATCNAYARPMEFAYNIFTRM